MGRSRRTEKSSTTTITAAKKSKTLPSSPSHSFSSSSSSDFEFTISLSPRTKSSTTNNHHYCPADELFYKGQLLPLHLSPRLSMVRTLLLASSSTSSSSDTNTTASRDSSGSSNDSHSSFTSADLAVLLPLPHPSAVADCDSSRPSSVTEDDEFKRLTNNFQHPSSHHLNHHHQIKKNKYFSLSRFSSVFRKDPKGTAKDSENATNSSVKRMSSSATDVIRKYLKKVKPLYEKLSQRQQQKMGGISTVSTVASVFALPSNKTERSAKQSETSLIQSSRSKDSSSNNNGGISHSFSGNLRYPRRRSCVSSCPSSMRSSPSHSGVLSKNGFASTSSTTTTTTRTTTTCKIIGGGGGIGFNKDSSMEELQSAIQGAIAHCKNSMLVQNKTMVSSSSNEI